MNAAFAARLPFKMFHSVGDINFFAIDPRLFESAIHDFSGRTDERFAGNVFVIAGLFADEVAPKQFETFINYLRAQPGGRVTDLERLGLGLVGFAVVVAVAGVLLGLIGAWITKKRGGRG